MKVLYITRKYPPQVGGMETFSYNLVKNMKCNMDVLALKKSNINLIWFFPYALIYAIINAKKYDIIHLGDMVLSGIGWVIKLFYPKKIVTVNIHGLDITYSFKIYQIYLKLFGHKCDKYICNSSNTESLANDMGIKRTIVISLGVDVNKFKDVSCNKSKFKEKYNIPNENIIMITTGRLVKRKGVLWFVNNVMPYYANKNLTYLIVGQGECYENIKSAISNNNLDKQVLMLGRVSDEDLKEIYVNADIFVMPNIKVENDVEGFGLVALEAALSKNTVIGSNLEGIKDAICNLKNGILIEQKNSEAYINEINKVINNYKEYEKFSAIASEYTIKNYSWEYICDLYVEEFNKIIKN